jgi:SAM-dependent methyltransferase
MRIDPDDTSYRTFYKLIGAYRIFYVTQEAIRSGIIDLLDKDDGYSADAVISRLNLKKEEGNRFLAVLKDVGLLVINNNNWNLSQFSKTYLSRSSHSGQRSCLEFEPLLLENWRQLGTILQEGQGALVREQPQDQYLERLQLFHHAMAEAARIRSRELWDAVENLPERGGILDLGAGDGTYLREFLKRRPQWHGVLCDLPDVCERVAPQSTSENLTLFPCNLLNHKEVDVLIEEYRGTAEIVLLSNLYHCYAPDENLILLQQIVQLVNNNGLLIIHDFFRDANSFSAMYDLHMLVNTLNGRTYSISETCSMVASVGFSHYEIIQLPSFSLALVASSTFHPVLKHMQTTKNGTANFTDKTIPLDGKIRGCYENTIINTLKTE